MLSEREEKVMNDIKSYINNQQINEKVNGKIEDDFLKDLLICQCNNMSVDFIDITSFFIDKLLNINQKLVSKVKYLVKDNEYGININSYLYTKKKDEMSITEMHKVYPVSAIDITTNNSYSIVLLKKAIERNQVILGRFIQDIEPYDYEDNTNMDFKELFWKENTNIIRYKNGIPACLIIYEIITKLVDDDPTLKKSSTNAKDILKVMTFYYFNNIKATINLTNKKTLTMLPLDDMFMLFKRCIEFFRTIIYLFSDKIYITTEYFDFYSAFYGMFVKKYDDVSCAIIGGIMIEDTKDIKDTIVNIYNSYNDNGFDNFNLKYRLKFNCSKVNDKIKSWIDSNIYREYIPDKLFI